MKKQYFITILISILFVALFYRQEPALNTLIFSILLATGLFITGFRKAKVALAAFVLSALGVYIYGNSLSLITCFIFFFTLAGQTSFEHLPVTFTLFPGLLKLMSAFPMQITRIISFKRNNTSNEQDEKTVSSLIKFALTGLALLIFFILYANASTGFSMMLDSVSFNIPNFDFWFLLLMSCFISHAIFYRQGKSLIKYLVPRMEDKLPVSGGGKKNAWLSTGTMMFAALSLLATVVLCSDLYFIISGSAGIQNPAFYSNLVHEGVGALMFSFFIAILLLLVFFEGRINFLPKNTAAKQWAYVWIVCNMAMILLTYYKNGLYIGNAGLTYKRIGVWYYLLTCGIVLTFIYFKIRHNMNFIYLLKKSCSLCMVILLISSFIPWEFTVTSFNIYQAKKHNKLADIEYLMSLDGHNLHMVRDYIREESLRFNTWANWNPTFENIESYTSMYQGKNLLSIPLVEHYGVRKLQETGDQY